MTRQSMLDDVNLRYRNTFTTEQKLVWVNDYEKVLFDIFQIDAPPYNFQTVQDESTYPIPSEIDIHKIKVMTMEVADDIYREIPFKRNDDHMRASNSTLWYTIVGGNFYIHYPSGMPDFRNVYIYHDIKPEEWTTDNLEEEPSTPDKYKEILKLHLLEMIAAARKDVIMKNNFETDKNQRIDDFIWQMKMEEPEFITPSDELTRAGRYSSYRRWR